MQLFQVYKATLQAKPKFIPYPGKVPVTNPNTDYYVSLFQYSAEQKKEAEIKGTVAGIKSVTTDTLYFDMDSKDDLELARKDALEVVKRLVDQGVDPEHIKASFTGSKGFSVEIKLAHRITNEQFKAAVQRLAGDLQTFDHVVSDPNRIIRVDNTKHPKSGNFKIPLTVYDLDELSLDTILNMSSINANLHKEFKPVKLPENLFKVEEKKVKAEIKGDLKEALETIPKGWKNYKWALASGFFESGERHNALMVIAATCRGLGYDKVTAYHICKSAAEKQATRSGNDKFPKDELYENIIDKSVYSENWEGGQYSPKTNPWLKKYCERMGFDTEIKDDSAQQIRDVREQFEHFVKHIDENTILTGIRTLDEAVPLTVGMNLGILGAASSGKTALALEILKNTSQAGIISVFASLDMHRNRLYEKLLYKVSGLSRTDLYTKIQNDEAEEIFKKIDEEYKNVWFYDRSCPTVKNIREYIEEVEQITGQKVKLVMLDYFERVNSEKSDETAGSKDIAGQLQDLVNDFNVCMITLVQPNKFSISGGPDKPLLNYGSIKGSSFIYQAFRSIISIWRPFFNPETQENDKYLQMAILKNDLGELGKFSFAWSGKRGEIRELTEEEEGQMNYLLEQKKATEAGNKDSGGWE